MHDGQLTGMITYLVVFWVVCLILRRVSYRFSSVGTSAYTVRGFLPRDNYAIDIGLCLTSAFALLNFWLIDFRQNVHR